MALSATVSQTERRILDAAKSCCERWGFAKVTIEDIAAESGVSRATLYRLFPGGKDVLFDALRVRELEEFFALLASQVETTDNLEDLLVATVVAATRELHADKHLALMMASEPGEALSQLTVAGLPRIIRMATVTLTPMVGQLRPTQDRHAADRRARPPHDLVLPRPERRRRSRRRSLGARLPAAGDRRARTVARRPQPDPLTDPHTDRSSPP